MNFKLKIWRQKLGNSQGFFSDYLISNIDPDTSFLEMLDILNEQLVIQGEDPVAFEHDCREGICGSCSMTINGRPHGPNRLTTACQLKMRSFADGAEIVIEPWRAKAFPIVKDLVTDRSAFDRIQQAGGYVSVNTGAACDANTIPVEKESADLSFYAASCIGCGACVAACPNGSAMLFTAAKVAQLSLLPQGAPERSHRAIAMVERMDQENFGGCTNHGECQAACPKDISIRFISDLNREFITAQAKKIYGKRASRRS
ncbi:MAG TPA: succinate dehydrogenase/fumarate reductase iron-sulfur subunit [Oligoflexia bacterium]|nr:succinate dehydrogenase/fumarate reductase iron-sulfur subunit [Oligoflexia bacterium]HMP26686.1 succinate dehydrogenase/fumarate reductase iron-sulfur subunit [Oligoflexia bacterium]